MEPAAAIEGFGFSLWPAKTRQAEAWRRRERGIGGQDRHRRCRAHAATLNQQLASGDVTSGSRRPDHSSITPRGIGRIVTGPGCRFVRRTDEER